MEICHIFTLTVDIKNPWCEFEDIYHQIFPLKFMKIQHYSWKVDLISNSAYSLPLKLNLLPLVTSDFHEILEGIPASECLQIHTRDF